MNTSLTSSSSLGRAGKNRDDLVMANTATPAGVELPTGRANTLHLCGIETVALNPNKSISLQLNASSRPVTSKRLPDNYLSNSSPSLSMSVVPVILE